MEQRMDTDAIGQSVTENRQVSGDTGESGTSLLEQLAGISGRGGSNRSDHREGKRTGRKTDRGEAGSEGITEVPIKRGRKASAESFSSDSLATLVSGAFKAIASITADHWSREPEEVKPLTDPIAVYVNGLDAKTSKRYAGIITPISILLGAITVIGPSVALELLRRKQGAYDGNFAGAITGEEGGSIAQSIPSSLRDLSSEVR